MVNVNDQNQKRWEGRVVFYSRGYLLYYYYLRTDRSVCLWRTDRANSILHWETDRPFSMCTKYVIVIEYILHTTYLCSSFWHLFF